MVYMTEVTGASDEAIRRAETSVTCLQRRNMLHSVQQTRFTDTRAGTSV